MASGLLVVLAAEVNLFVAQHGSRHGELVHVLFELGEQEVREIEIVAQLADVQIFRRAFVLLEVERLNVADGPGDLVEENIAGRAARLYFLLAGLHLQRPDAIHRCADQTESAQLEQIATG